MPNPDSYYFEIHYQDSDITEYHYPEGDFPESDSTWGWWKQELDSLIDGCKDKYKEYRSVIRDSLII